ncbi:hypothetical protein LTR22_027073 [Elasticomyces elasticus]|nr:hypothetical protein LTR22_027073 [Elasticomyces elasticus]
MSTLNTVDNLRSFRKNQGKLDQARQMYIRALKRKEKVLKAEHTSTLTTVDTLGILYSDQGKIKEAEEIHLRAAERLVCDGTYRQKESQQRTAFQASSVGL